MGKVKKEFFFISTQECRFSIGIALEVPGKGRDFRCITAQYLSQIEMREPIAPTVLLINECGRFLLLLYREQ